jgi:hypothetical protein
MHDAKASLLHWSDTRLVLTPCACNKPFNKLTNMQKLQAVYDMQRGMTVKQVMTMTSQPASLP